MFVDKGFRNLTVQSLEQSSIDISLSSPPEKVVKEKVASGLYNSPSEVVGEALRLLDDHDRLQQIKLERLRNDIREGLDNGESAPLDIEDMKAEAGSEGGSSKVSEASDVNAPSSQKAPRAG